MYLARFLNQLFKYGGFILVTYDKKEYIIGNPSKENPLKLVLFEKSLNYKLLFFPDLYLGEAYTDGTLKIENGSISDFLELALKNMGRKKTNKFSQLINKFRGKYRFLTNFNFRNKSRLNVAHHYDISDHLYELFLDKKKQYSCGYFKNENEDLDQAQNNKIKHIIKKLNIKPNQKVLDIGSGWGWLAIEIAREAKCEVTGITLSKNQLEYSKKKIEEMNLTNQVQFKFQDYRDLNQKFDRIVSVGMFEHVGRKFYSAYFNKVSELLKDNGVALIHTIGSVNSPRDPHPWITKYIFPGGYTPSLSEVAGPIEKSGLIVSDIEVLRMHYSHTLRNWKDRFLSNREKVKEMFDEKFIRMWEFYLAGCEMAFKWGDQVVFQLQLSKKTSSVPITRDYLYQK